ncbi:hypothetical protein B0T09DRAFT_333879 [Sordaria sp. MPI-SDFR-AT-0083]|nr:hypothetical protein B0T09DRAFT_333879 [Sordaria sp. MPI-SDFR-AT-0083]
MCLSLPRLFLNIAAARILPWNGHLKSGWTWTGSRPDLGVPAISFRREGFRISYLCRIRLWMPFRGGYQGIAEKKKRKKKNKTRGRP